MQTPSHWPLCLFDMSPLIFSGTRRCSRLISYFLFSNLRVNDFCKHPWFPFRTYLEAKICTKCTLWYWSVIASSLLNRARKKCMYVCIYTSVSISRSVRCYVFVSVNCMCICMYILCMSLSSYRYFHYNTNTRFILVFLLSLLLVQQ